MILFKSILDEQIVKYRNRTGSGRHKHQNIVFAEILKKILDQQNLLNVQVPAEQDFSKQLFNTVHSLRASNFGGYSYEHSLENLRLPINWPEEMKDLVTMLRDYQLLNLSDNSQYYDESIVSLVDHECNSELTRLLEDPINLEIMDNPYTLKSVGHTMNWASWSSSKGCSPLTRQTFLMNDLEENIVVKKVINLIKFHGNNTGLLVADIYHYLIANANKAIDDVVEQTIILKDIKQFILDYCNRKQIMQHIKPTLTISAGNSSSSSSTDLPVDVNDYRFIEHSLKTIIQQFTQGLAEGTWLRLNKASQKIEVGIGAATKKPSIATDFYSISIDDTGRLSMFDKITKKIVSDEHTQAVILKQMFDLIPKEHLRQLPIPSSSHSAYLSGNSLFSSSSSSSSSAPPEPKHDLDEESLSTKPTQ